VRMGHLGDGQQRQQEQTHRSDQRQSPRLCAATAAENRLKTCQKPTPAFKNTQNWMHP
jgi:hypothetical protein